MNKQQRDYTIGRIKKISSGKEFECECDKPSIRKHLRRAVIAGEAQLKPAKKIIEFFEGKILNGGYSDPDADLEDIFVEPQSFKVAVAELKAEQDKHAVENNATKRFAQGIIDRIELGEFEDGTEPIRLMEAYEPKKPAAKKPR